MGCYRFFDEVKEFEGILMLEQVGLYNEGRDIFV